MVCCKSRDHMTKCRHEKVCGSICLRVSKHKKGIKKTSVNQVSKRFCMHTGYFWAHDTICLPTSGACLMAMA
jgi:hypothetical protein